MQFNRFIRTAQNASERLFHKRSVIVISEHQTNHFSISGRSQFISAALLIGCVGWGSYVTGGYMSARTVLEQKDEALKSVANSRIESSFQYFGSTLQPQNLAPVSTLSGPALSEPSFSYSAVDQDRLFARIAFLEGRVSELKNANEEIIQTVREKTNGQIATLESVIRKTGLDPAQLKKAVKDADGAAAATPDAKGNPQGGPFIPAELSSVENSIPQDLFVPLDQLAILNQIVDTLPLASPMEGATQQSTFGRRLDPFSKRLAFHAGVDLSGPAGAKVMASNSGKVIDAGYNGAYGNMIDIDHGFGIVTRYGHLSQIKVREGQTVKKGQLIGVQGSTGRSTGSHLHYEVRYKDQPVNPANFLKAGLYVSKE